MSNKRYLHIWILIAVIAWPFIFFNTGCKSTKRVATAVTTSPPKPLEDRSVQDLLEKLEKNSFKPEYLSAKASVVMKEGESETSFNITMRCKRDSIIWISISPLLGIEVARVLVTPDSVKFIDRIHGKYQASSFETINKILQLKVNFEIVQCILQGNFFAYKKNENRFKRSNESNGSGACDCYPLGCFLWKREIWEYICGCCLPVREWFFYSIG